MRSLSQGDIVVIGNLNCRGVIVFDFDGTLTKVDSYAYLLRCAVAHYGYKRALLKIFFRIHSIFNFSNDTLKRMTFLFFLKGLRENQVDEVAMSFVKENNLCLNFVELVSSLLRKEYLVLIATASPEFYVKKIMFLYDRNLALLDNFKVFGSIIALEHAKLSRFVLNLYAQKKRDLIVGMGITRLDALYTDSEDDFCLHEMCDRIVLVKNCTVEKEIIKP